MRGRNAFVCWEGSYLYNIALDLSSRFGALATMKGRCTCRYENKEGKAVVTLRRRHFDESSLPRLLSRETHAALQFENDIYIKAIHLLMNFV